MTNFYLPSRSWGLTHIFDRDRLEPARSQPDRLGIVAVPAAGYPVSPAELALLSRNRLLKLTLSAPRFAFKPHRQL